MATALLAAVLAAARAAECESRWGVEGVALGQSLGAARAALEGAGHKAGRVRGSGTRPELVAALSGDRTLALVGSGGHGDSALLVSVTLVVPTPTGTGADYLAPRLSSWGEPTYRFDDRNGARADAWSEAAIWVDPSCDLRAVVLLRREITPRGTVLRYVATRIERLADLHRDLRLLERDADKLGGL